MTRLDARSRGRVGGIIYALALLLLAYVVTVPVARKIEGFQQPALWFLEVSYQLNVLVGILIFLLSSFIYGGRAGIAILVEGRNAFVTGLVFGLAVLFTTALLSGLTGFLQEGVEFIGYGDPVYDYIGKPFQMIVKFGFVPTALLSWLFGVFIRKKGSALDKHSA